MRFLIAKNNDKICLGCRANILHGEHYFQKFFYGAKRVFFFHIECYGKWSDKNFVRAYLEWKSSLNPPRVRGRPRKYTDSKEANRLKTRQNQYRKAGNWDRVKELETKIKEMEVSNAN